MIYRTRRYSRYVVSKDFPNFVAFCDSICEFYFHIQAYALISQTESILYVDKAKTDKGTILHLNSEPCVDECVKSVLISEMRTMP